MGALVLSAVLAMAPGVRAQDPDQVDARFGGPIYRGAPALAATASLVSAGGGPIDFSIAQAQTSIVGLDATNAELGKLRGEYGDKRVNRYILVFNYAIKDALYVATMDGVFLPVPSLSGKRLGTMLIMAGQDKDGTFYTGFLLDKALTHKVHDQVTKDIDAKYGPAADVDFHRISNQEHYDLGLTLGIPGIKLARLH